MDNYSKNLVLVDESDRIVGTERALKSHLDTHLSLHRGFSVFIFNSQKKLLVQRRACAKLVFPGRWANSVCSHPFLNKLSFADPVLDVKIHAAARIRHELGIGSLHAGALEFVTRVLYKASDAETYSRIVPGEPAAQPAAEFVAKEDPVGCNVLCGFGEWEIDYVLTAVCDDICSPNSREIAEIRYVDRNEFCSIVAASNASPWLREISSLMDVFGIQEYKMPVHYIDQNLHPNGPASAEEGEDTEECNEVQEDAWKDKEPGRPADKGDKQRDCRKI